MRHPEFLNSGMFGSSTRQIMSFSSDGARTLMIVGLTHLIKPLIFIHHPCSEVWVVGDLRIHGAACPCEHPLTSCEHRREDGIHRGRLLEDLRPEPAGWQLSSAVSWPVSAPAPCMARCDSLFHPTRADRHCFFESGAQPPVNETEAQKAQPLLSANSYPRRPSKLGGARDPRSSTRCAA